MKASQILEREQFLMKKAVEKLSNVSNFRLLGQPTSENLPILSFMIAHEDLYLHHNFVCALLNDLFGIQARGGCACAGPYAQR